MPYDPHESLNPQDNTTLDSTHLESSCSSSPLHQPPDNHSFQQDIDYGTANLSDAASDFDGSCSFKPRHATHFQNENLQSKNYQTLYRMNYKSYIQNVLEVNKDHCALAEIKVQSTLNPLWLQEQVTKVKDLLNRLQLQQNNTSTETRRPTHDEPASPEPLHADCSSPIETARRVLEHSTPSFTCTTPNHFHNLSTQLSQRKSAQRHYHWRKRLATSSGKKGMDLKKINRIDDDVGLPHENDYNSFSYLASPILLPDTTFHHHTNMSEDAYPNQTSDHSFIHSNLMDTSLSPITQQEMSTSHHLPSMQDELDDESYIDDTSHVDDTIQSPNCTMIPRKARLNTNKHSTLRYVPRHRQLREDQRDEAPSNVVLQKGTFFHLQPLPIQQGQRRPYLHTISNYTTASREGNQRQKELQDPSKFFSQYGPRVMSTLRTASQWLLSRDDASSSSQQEQQQQQYRNRQPPSQHRAAVILNIHSNQAISLVLYMLAQNGTHKSRSSTSSSSSNFILPVSNNSYIAGGTLIVLRAKDDLPLWERALREQSCHSVWNHATVPAKSRRRVAETAAKCAGNHVVLTTIECIKTKEVPILVDVNGRAVNVHSNNQGKQFSQPWFSSRNIGTERKQKSTEILDEEIQSNYSDSDSISTSSTTNSQPVVKVLSALHPVRWHRLIFVDTLAKSYLTQPTGVRSEAAIALHGSSRFVALLSISRLS